MKRKFKQWWSSIPPISTKQTLTPHLNWTYWTPKKLWHVMMEIHVLIWDRHKNVAGLNWLMWSPLPPLLDNWISNGNTNINKQNIKKPAQICFQSKRWLFLFIASNKLYICVVSRDDHYVRKDGGQFNAEEFEQYPSRYASTFATKVCCKHVT
jgi:hypothetical protein